MTVLRVDYAPAASRLAHDQIFDTDLLRRLLRQGIRAEAAPAPAERIRGIRADSVYLDEEGGLTFLGEVAAQFQAEGASRFFLPRGVELTPPPVSIPMAGEAPAAEPVVPAVEVGTFAPAALEPLPPAVTADVFENYRRLLLDRLVAGLGTPSALFDGPVTFGPPRPVTEDTCVAPRPAPGPAWPSER